MFVLKCCPHSSLTMLRGTLKKLHFRLRSVRSFTSTSFNCSMNSDEKSSISRFPIPEMDTLPSDLQEIMKVTEEKSGFIPNVFKVLSHRPEEFRAFVSYYNAVMDIRDGGKLTKADKEMIIVAVSAHNKCKYCIIAHGALFRIFSKNTVLPDEVTANWETANIDDRQRAILEFAMDVAECKHLKEERFQALYEHGLTEEDAWDIGAVVALFSLSNRMAFLTNMAPNKEFHMLGRVPKSLERK